MVSVSLTGVSAIGSVGNVLIWEVVNTNQTPSWVAVNDSQTPNWVQIAT